MENSDNGKTISIISYLTLVGWIIAFIMHSNNKTDLAAFHLRQMLGIIIVGIALNVIGIFSGIDFLFWILRLASVLLWGLGFMGAIQGEKKLVPVLGEQFQNWFKGIA
jgi:uncharacterized membrane protein